MEAEVVQNKKQVFDGERWPSFVVVGLAGKDSIAAAAVAAVDDGTVKFEEGMRKQVEDKKLVAVQDKKIVVGMVMVDFDYQGSVMNLKGF